MPVPENVDIQSLWLKVIKTIKLVNKKIVIRQQYHSVIGSSTWLYLQTFYYETTRLTKCYDEHKLVDIHCFLNLILLSIFVKKRAMENEQIKMWMSLNSRSFSMKRKVVSCVSLRLQSCAVRVFVIRKKSPLQCRTLSKMDFYRQSTKMAMIKIIM